MALIRLSDCHIESDKRFAGARDTRYKADAFFLFRFAFSDDIQNVPDRTVRRHLIRLMTGDIFNNIVGTTALTRADAWAAAEAVGIADDIRKMPMGMQTVISEGSSNISGGQRQRILIARALAARPSIIVFDEATSALDNRTQAIVTESLRRMNATRIVVAHRLSTIKDCDRILVLDGGRLAESGNFDELVSQGGIFSSMVKRQIA